MNEASRNPTKYVFCMYYVEYYVYDVEIVLR